MVFAEWSRTRPSVELQPSPVSRYLRAFPRHMTRPRGWLSQMHWSEYLSWSLILFASVSCTHCLFDHQGVEASGGAQVLFAWQTIFRSWLESLWYHQGKWLSTFAIDCVFPKLCWGCPCHLALVVTYLEWCVSFLVD